MGDVTRLRRLFSRQRQIAIEHELDGEQVLTGYGARRRRARARRLRALLRELFGGES